MDSKSLPLTVDLNAAKAASAPPDHIPFTVQQSVVFLDFSPQNDERRKVGVQNP